VVYPAGMEIVKQGDEADAFYVIQSGEVAVTELDDEELGTGSHVLCRLYEGHFFGQYWWVDVA
jgi:CRP-like cAMP-binding protein